MEKLYECIEDLQVEDQKEGLGVGYRLDAEGWKKMALSWTEAPEVVARIKNLNGSASVKYIAEAFGLKILEVC